MKVQLGRSARSPVQMASKHYFTSVESCFHPMSCTLKAHIPWVMAMSVPQHVESYLRTLKPPIRTTYPHGVVFSRCLIPRFFCCFASSYEHRFPELDTFPSVSRLAERIVSANVRIEMLCAWSDEYGFEINATSTFSGATIQTGMNNAVVRLSSSAPGSIAQDRMFPMCSSGPG